MENNGRRSAEEYSVGLESLGLRVGKSAYCADVVMYLWLFSIRDNVLVGGNDLVIEGWPVGSSIVCIPVNWI